MELLGISLMEHARIIDRLTDFSSFSGKSFASWMEPLAESVTETGYVPYLMQTKERYRASPLASVINGLDCEGLIPANVLAKMQEALLSLRDTNVSCDPTLGKGEKFPEDSAGWSLGEGVSVWSTSLAIIAMLDRQGIGLAKASEIKPSILWLTMQQRINEKGWAYQLNDNCAVNTVMTSLALQALAQSLHPRYSKAFSFSDEEYRRIISSIQMGFEYIKSSCVQNKQLNYWCFNGKPHCAATTWNLIALKQMKDINDSCALTFQKLYDLLLAGGLRFILSKIPSNAQEWEQEQLVYEGGAKYSKQKNYFSYSATLLPQLFELGLSPYHPKIINQIKWLIANPKEWKIKGYDRTSVCTFTYATVLAVLAGWSRRVGSVFASSINCTSKGKMARVATFIWGYPNIPHSPIQFVQKNRIWKAFDLLTLALVLLIYGRRINDFIRICASNIVNIWTNTADDLHDILINIIAGIICAIIFFIFNLIVRKIRRNK